MVKTLRITSVVAVMIAIAIFALPIKYGVRTDASIENFLSAPGVIEKFKASSGNRKQLPANQVHPLVQQAQAYANIIDPPKPVIPKNVAKTQGRSPAVISPPKNTPMFKVKGIIYYADNPKLSLALIDEPGKGSHWVTQSSTVNHLLIEQIKDGVVIVRNGEESFELKTEERKMPMPIPVIAEIPNSRVSPVIKTIRTSPPPGLEVSNQSGIYKTEPDPEQAQRLQKLIEKIRSLGIAGSDSGQTPSKEERDEQIQKLIEEFKNSNINDEEAKKLSDLGDMLQKMQSPDSGQ